MVKDPMDDVELVRQWVHDMARGVITSDKDGAYGIFVRLMNELLDARAAMQELKNYRTGVKKSEFASWFERVHPESLHSVTVTFK